LKAKPRLEALGIDVNHAISGTTSTSFWKNSTIAKYSWSETDYEKQRNHKKTWP
jgi:short-subunit dehydrogenase